MHLTIMPRMKVRYYEPPSPAYVDLTKLYNKWYWRPLHWLLRKLGMEYHDRIPESYRVEEIAIKQENVRALISSSQKALNVLWREKATTLVIGCDEMEKLVGEAMTEPMTFYMPFVMQNAERDPRRPDFPPEIQTITRNLRVVLAPWLSGWALLPDLEKLPQAQGDYQRY